MARLRRTTAVGVWVLLAVLGAAVGADSATTAEYPYDVHGHVSVGRSDAVADKRVHARRDQAATYRAELHGYDFPSHFAQTDALPLSRFHAPQAISAGDEVASSAAQGARLSEHLRLSERYGAGGVRELADGRIRYYGELTPAAKPGDMAGARLVREWSPAADRYRTWYETLDHAGRVRQVHPYQPYSEHHYWFDEFGNYGGRR